MYDRIVMQFSAVPALFAFHLSSGETTPDVEGNGTMAKLKQRTTVMVTLLQKMNNFYSLLLTTIPANQCRDGCFSIQVIC